MQWCVPVKRLGLTPTGVLPTDSLWSYSSTAMEVDKAPSGSSDAIPKIPPKPTITTAEKAPNGSAIDACARQSKPVNRCRQRNYTEEGMTGREIIDWAIKRCKQEELPPTDSNILLFINEWELTLCTKCETEARKQQERL